MNEMKLTRAQEDIVRTLARAGMIDFDGRRARALQVLERVRLIRQYPGRGYMLTDAGRKLASSLPTNGQPR